MIYEAQCKKCGETFNPTPTVELRDGTGKVSYTFAAGDLEHGQNNAQTEVCGGQGEMTGIWR